jgi:L,D-peptidoglycan transpeptidase YkuD (ErfK/YbiS/YcfS/YnhG family)
MKFKEEQMEKDKRYKYFISSDYDISNLVEFINSSDIQSYIFLHVEKENRDILGCSENLKIYDVVRILLNLKEETIGQINQQFEVDETIEKIKGFIRSAGDGRDGVLH